MMVFNSSERVLPPIMTLETSSQISENTILPPVSCLAPEMPTLSSNPPHDISRISTSSPMHVSGTYIYPTSYVSTTPSPSSSSSSSSSSSWKFVPTSASHISMIAPSQVHSQISPQVPPQIPPQISSQIPPPIPTTSRSNDHHNLIAKPIHNQYPYQTYVDPASELLAEKRRRNAGASARFRDRRKQREREMKEKCQFLERRVQELEGMNNVKRIIELEKKLEEANEETIASQTKIRELERNVQKLKAKLRVQEEVEFLTPPPSAVGEDSEGCEFSFKTSRSHSTTSMSSEESPRKSIDVKSLLL